MKNKIIYLLLVSGLLIFNNVVHANDSEVKLKRSCIKANPLVDGESDPDLLNIYAQVCDKKNTENKLLLLTQAANRFQQLGKPLKSLMLVDFLEKQNVNIAALTDVKFLIGVDLAKSSLTKMRENESRYLSVDKTYPPAKSFVDLYRTSLPSEEIVKSKGDEERSKAGNKHKISERHTRTGKKINQNKPKTVAPKPHVQRQTVAPTPVSSTSKTTSKTPFSGF